jgi:hypothetical protein
LACKIEKPVQGWMLVKMTGQIPIQSARSKLNSPRKAVLVHKKLRTPANDNTLGAY